MSGRKVPWQSSMLHEEPDPAMRQSVSRRMHRVATIAETSSGSIAMSLGCSGAPARCFASTYGVGTAIARLRWRYGIVCTTVTCRRHMASALQSSAYDGGTGLFAQLSHASAPFLGNLCDMENTTDGVLSTLIWGTCLFHSACMYGRPDGAGTRSYAPAT